MQKELKEAFRLYDKDGECTFGGFHGPIISLQEGTFMSYLSHTYTYTLYHTVNSYQYYNEDSR